MPYVYGDSTPFPYDVDCIELLRNTVDCCVQLLSAEHAVAVAQERARSWNTVQVAERAELAALWEMLKRSLGAAQVASERGVRAVQSSLGAARASIDEELANLDRDLSKEAAQTRSIIERAVETSCQAIQGFLVKGDVPETYQALRLVAFEESYNADVSVQTPYGLDAVLSVPIPAGHAWSSSRRVEHLAPGIEVHLPQEAGWLSKRIELAKVKLDRYFISSVALAPAHASIQLRKNATSGSGYQLDVAYEPHPRAALSLLPEDGVLGSEPPLPLADEDRVHAFDLVRKLHESAWELTARRERLISAVFDGRSLGEIEAPRRIAERIIARIGPLAQEIARRSGAPGEYVIRRDLGQGRREEVYIHRAELEQKILLLSPELRVAFEPCGLNTSAAAASTPRSQEQVRVSGEVDIDVPLSSETETSAA